MSFRIHPVKEFLVSPALPEQIARIGELAQNLLWSWDPTIRMTFRRLDPVLWKNCGRNPVLMLARVPQATLEKAAADPRYVAVYRKACERHDAYMAQGALDAAHKDSMLVAYFSMEYGLLESLTIYSGGLGILSGDHLKAASDMRLNLVGIGLLYQTGYLSQHLTADGWQTEKYPINDFYTWPVQPLLDANGQEIRVYVDLPMGRCHIKVWRLKSPSVPDPARHQQFPKTNGLRSGTSPTSCMAATTTSGSGKRSFWALAGCAP